MSPQDIDVASDIILLMQKRGLSLESMLAALSTAECLALGATKSGLSYSEAAVAMHRHHENAANDLLTAYKHFNGRVR